MSHTRSRKIRYEDIRIRVLHDSRAVFMPGGRHRERVITPAEEAKYLASTSPLLVSVATVLIDTGMRPEQCFRQRWEHVTWVNGRHGSLLVTHGKTATARRLLP